MIELEGLADDLQGGRVELHHAPLVQPREHRRAAGTRADGPAGRVEGQRLLRHHLPRRRIPQPSHGVVEADRHEEPPVGGPVVPADAAVLRVVQRTELRARDVEERQVAAAVGFVDVGDRCAIGTRRHVHDRQRLGVAVGMDLAHHSSITRQIPLDDDAVDRGRVQRRRVLHELEGRRRRCVAGEALEQLAVGRIPDRDAAVLPSRRDPFARRARR